MSTTDTLDVATGGETITGASLQASIDRMLTMSSSLNADIAAAPDFESVQAIGRAQADLNAQAMEMVTAQISLKAGEAKITADHVNAATQAVQDAIAKMADWRKKVAAVGKLVDFFVAVGTGKGGKIVQAAIDLKKAF